jgi:ABC-2 type transport system permease protein
MRRIQAVAWKEMQIYFTSPMGYIVGMIYLAINGVFFVQDLGLPFPEASLSNVFQGATIILIMLAPALTMRLLAEERKLGTVELLLTAPVRDWEVVAGKYLAGLAFLLALVAVSGYYVLLLFVFASPDPGPIYVGYLGLVLYGAAALAVGLLASALTSNQIVAAVVAMGILLVLYFTDFAAGAVGGGQGLAATVIGEMSTKAHFDDFARGVLDTKHVAYFLLLSAVFLFLTVRALEARRWR